MRFFEDGPSIPDLLLERRDQGRVVFLCGAGVSLNAGMPTFYTLTKYVVDFFDPPEDSVISLEFKPWVEDSESGKNRPKTPLDQIFHLLYQEYGREEVNALVSSRLRDENAERMQSFEHSVIARISANREGRPQIVTTNFDRLFERALVNGHFEINYPPALPDISLGIPLSGITYLHGRVQEQATESHSYVLSSSDFGRAYLSEGWATNFIRALLKRYTVVLVGYQAEDPPVKYLLQGLNHDGLSDRSNLYAFDKGNPEDIEAKWRDRGVTAIACKDYPSLWQSLEAWAIRSVDPRQWKLDVISMAMNGPRELKAHERGQVVQLVRTTPGARLFAKAEPSPPPEWLCVFDSWCRIAKKSSNYAADAETFDPFMEYGLDDDPPLPAESVTEIKWVHDHILEWRKGDANPSAFHALSGQQPAGLEEMPPRLLHLSNWIVRHLDSPIVAWWVARQRGLHPRLLKNLQNNLRHKKDFKQKARQVWNLILEFQYQSRNLHLDFSWYELQDRVRTEGWTPSVLRDFEVIASPTLFFERPFGIARSKPPFGSWDEIGTESIARWEVKFPEGCREKLDVPDEILLPVFRIAERHLQRAASLLEDLETPFIFPLTCYPNRENDEEDHGHHAFFCWFLELFSRMVSNHPKVARGIADVWSVEEKYYFEKLKLFALNHIELFGPDEAAGLVLALTQQCFWGSDLRRELMFLINDRWEEFSEENREALAKRLLNGPNKKDYWSDKEYPNIRDNTACRYVRWLTLQGRSLSEGQTARLNEMIAALPEWGDDWALCLTEERLGSLRRIDTDDSPDSIINLPISEIINHVTTEQVRDFDSYTQKRPFKGLVKENPRKALAALSHHARLGEYPPAYWSTLIESWPENTRTRLYRVFLNRLCRLPHVTIRELRHSVGQWLEEKLLLTYEFNEHLAWSVFDHLVLGLVSEGGIATVSGIGEARRNGEVVVQSRRTFNYAINSPVGSAMQGLHKTLASLKLEKTIGIPDDFKLRIEQLIASAGEGGDHAIIMTTRNIHWLNYLDPKWVSERVMPWFDFDQNLAEPAWNGYFAAAKIPSQEIGIALKPLLLKLFPNLYKWNWDQQFTTIAVQIVIELSIFCSNKPEGLSHTEARQCLRHMNDRNRQDAIYRLRVIGEREQNGWVEYVIPFINTVWPRERAFRTSTLVSSWVTLLERSRDRFPETLSAVSRFLVPVERKIHWLYQLRREIGDEAPLTVKYPESVLDLLHSVIPNSAEDVPIELAQILDLIEEVNAALTRDHRFIRLKGLIEET